MSAYDTTRELYKPAKIKVLMVAESQPPANDLKSSRQFSRTDKQYPDDRLFINTIRALYPEAADIKQTDLEANKRSWLERFQHDGWFMIEALTTSLKHEVTKQERQEQIRKNLPDLIARVQKLAASDTKLILIKSNVFDIAAQPLRDTGFDVLNTELLDYPGRFNQRAYREKLAALAARIR